MHRLKVKTTIICNTCGCRLKRTKTIKVSATDIEKAKKEADAKITAWTASLKGQNCRTCQSIINDVKNNK